MLVLKRLFFALWPSAEVRDEIAALNQQLRVEGVRKLRPSNLHMTLLYLGNIDAAMQQKIISKVTQIACAPFSFQLDGMDFWKTPKVICLTVTQQPKPLLDLAHQLRGICQHYPIHLHDRPYQGHVTLMRKAKQAYALDFTPIQWQAKSFVLVESISTEQGIRYEILRRWPLRDE